MDKPEILKEVTNIFRKVLENKNIHLEYGTSARDIDEWDSLSHIQLIVAIEKHFKVRFKSKDIQNWKNIGEMINTLAGMV